MYVSTNTLFISVVQSLPEEDRKHDLILDYIDKNCG